MTDFSHSTWKQLGDKQNEIDMLHAENALKLTQILDLEIILYNTRVLDLEDGSPCWCCLPFTTAKSQGHDLDCDKARKATEPFWKKDKK